jgi:RNA polymerase sigma-70 factor (ECF subfamily)
MVEPQMTTPDGHQQSVVSDELLAAHLQSGDAVAGDELVRRFAKPLLGYLARLTGSNQLADELHQQTWLSALEHLDRFDPESGAGSFKAWLFRIATNKATDVWRSRARLRKVEDGLRLMGEETTPDAGSRLEATETQSKVRQAIDLLPESQKQVVLMRYYAKMKFTEIAEALGCPLNTALGRMHKATLKLREILGSP